MPRPRGPGLSGILLCFGFQPPNQDAHSGVPVLILVSGFESLSILVALHTTHTLLSKKLVKNGVCLKLDASEKKKVDVKAGLPG